MDFENTIRIFLVDDDPTLLKALTQAFELENMDVVPFSSAEMAIPEIAPSSPIIVITDVRMPNISGIEFFQKVKGIDSEIPVIFITGHADVPMVLSTLRDGAFDFFPKPIDVEHLLGAARRAADNRRLVLENRSLRELAEKATQNTNLIGESPAIERLRTTIKQIAQADVDVLVEGETGTGKEIVATMLHKLSNRDAFKMVTVNCAALPADIAEGELFGSNYDEKTLSRRERPGKIEQSHKGTLFLDEIECLPSSLQGQLLPVVQDREITPVGAKESKALNLRIIASTQKDLTANPDEHGFRSDLLYRLNTIHLRIPPLRDRREDIPLLFSHFVAQAAKSFSKKLPKISASARRRLIDYDWPGNVRELKNFADSIVLGIDNANGSGLGVQLSLPQRVERFESNTIKSALEQTHGDVRATLELLGIPRKTFYDKISRHEIDLNRYRQKATAR